MVLPKKKKKGDEIVVYTIQIKQDWRKNKTVHTIQIKKGEKTKHAKDKTKRRDKIEYI